MAADQDKKKSTSKPDACSLYESGLKALYSGQHAEAEETFRKLIGTFPEETSIVERARTFLRTAQRRQKEPLSTDSKDGELLFDSGVFHHNSGDYTQALKYYEKGLKIAGKKKDNFLYAMAAAEAQNGNPKKALTHLKAAVELNPENRFFAANDPDLRLLAENAEFVTLLGGRGRKKG